MRSMAGETGAALRHHARALRGVNIGEGVMPDPWSEASQSQSAPARHHVVKPVTIGFIMLRNNSVINANVRSVCLVINANVRSVCLVINANVRSVCR